MTNGIATDDIEPEEDVTLFKSASNNSYFACTSTLFQNRESTNSNARS
ncbi:MAG: hypothetical protein ACI8TP_003063 [Acidimicrobiales bacterium]|jgi:hypothetical protein